MYANKIYSLENLHVRSNVLVGVSGEFRWDTYLREKRAIAAPSPTFYVSSVLQAENESSSAVEGIEVGMKLEITERANPDAFRVASVIDIVGTACVLPIGTCLNPPT